MSLGFTQGSVLSVSALSPTLTFIGRGILTNDGVGQHLTKIAASIGTASASRRVIVAAGGPMASGRTVSSVTIGGVTGVDHVELRNADSSWTTIASAAVPTGTTADIIFTMSSNIANDTDYAVWITDDTQLVSTTPTTGSAQDTDADVAPTVSGTNGGILVGVCTWANGSSKTPITVTGYTIDNSNNDSIFFSLVPLVGTGTKTATVAWVGSFGSSSCLAAWD